MKPLFSQDVSIACADGNLEGRLNYVTDTEGKPGVIICPPHPLLAGNMDNNVITSLAETLAVFFPVLTFNYRSVGKSFKADSDLPLFEYWSRLDQKNNFSEIIKDTSQVIEWSSRFFSEFHLIGYSFGSYIGLQALSDSALSYTAIVPPLAEHEFGRLPALSCQCLFIFADEDNLLLENKNEFPAGATIHSLSNTDHFFLKREKDIADIVSRFLTQQ